MKMRVFVALCSLFAIPASTVVVAQESPEGDPARFSVGVMGVMTDNRDSTRTGKQDNVDIFLRPRVELMFSGLTSTTLELFYEPALRYRTEPGETQDETDFQHHAGATLTHAFSPQARLRASDQLSVADDPAIEENGSVVRGDHSYLMNTAELGFNYDLFRYSNLDLMVQNNLRRFDDKSVAALSDKDETRLRAQHRYSLTRTLRTLLTGEYRLYAYKQSVTFNRDFDSAIGAIGLENEFAPGTIGSLSVGWQTRSFDDPLLDSKDKPYARAELSGWLNGDLRVGAVVGHGLRDSDSFPYPSQEFTDFRGFAEMHFSPRATARVAGTYRMSKYDAYYGLAGGDENVIVGDAEVTYKVADHASVLAGYRYEEIDSDSTVGSSYAKNTFRVGAVLSF